MSGLAGQVPEEVLVAILPVDPVAGVPAKRTQDALDSEILEEHRDESLVPHPVVVEVVADEHALKLDSPPRGRTLARLRLLVVPLRADDENEVGHVELAVHPCRPAFGRMSLVLIEGAIQAVPGQTIRQREDPCAVLGGVVAVADEDLGSGHGVFREPRRL